MANEVERHTSYGIGGAGNLRRPSVVEAAKEALASLPPEQSATSQRRRSSAWSMGSNADGSRRSSIWKSATGIFRRGSKDEEVVAKVEE